MKDILLFAAAALFEILGCFALWAYLRLDKPLWWLIPGAISLGLFAYLLTLSSADEAGRTYAAYGGIYILSSLFWLWTVEGVTPDRWDIGGAAICLFGAFIIIAAPR